MSRIEAVLFDLGETLLTFGRLDRPRLFNEAIAASYEYLRELDQPVGSFKAYRLVHLWGIRWHLFKSWRSGSDFNSLELLQGYGRKRGFQLTDAQWEELNWRWYKGLARLGSVKEGTAEALQTLSQMGLKLGLLSNTFIHKSSLERHLRREGLLDYLPVRLYSYELPQRKPDVGAFRQAAAAIDVSPSKIVYIGDRLDNDVAGARSAGMTPVLVRAYTNQSRRIPAGLPCVNSISELPELIKSLNEAAE
ncbi:MAG: HAD family hydrolase [Planctomycetaceae bacterium]|nr:HAD family hydrolase [Planctomycetaceae bacterium]